MVSPCVLNPQATQQTTPHSGVVLRVLKLLEWQGCTLSELNKAWRDIYYTLEDNAFDYVGKPFYNDNEGTVQLWNGSKFITYAEVPF